jgi:hypothetical protein
LNVVLCYGAAGIDVGPGQHGVADRDPQRLARRSTARRSAGSPRKGRARSTRPPRMLDLRRSATASREASITDECARRGA